MSNPGVRAREVGTLMLLCQDDTGQNSVYIPLAASTISRSELACECTAECSSELLRVPVHHEAVQAWAGNRLSTTMSLQQCLEVVKVRAHRLPAVRKETRLL